VRAIKPETAITMRQMMEGVVLVGTGKTTRLDGYTSGGKTGTAQIFDFATRHYTHTYNGSFMGFAPVTNPAVIVVVTVNGTHGRRAFGASAAGPVFRAVITEALRILDVPKDLPDAVPAKTDIAQNQKDQSVDDVSIADLGSRQPNILEDGDDDQPAAAPHGYAFVGPLAPGAQPPAPAASTFLPRYGAEFQGYDAAGRADGSRRQRTSHSTGRHRRCPRADSAAGSGVASGGTHSRPVCEMILGEILPRERLKQPLTPELAASEVAGIQYDSRRVHAGDLFFAFLGPAPMAAALRRTRWLAARWPWWPNLPRPKIWPRAGLKSTTDGRPWRSPRAISMGGPTSGWGSPVSPEPTEKPPPLT
jgi:hypothetical protein